MDEQVLLAVFDTNELVRIALGRTEAIRHMWQAVLQGRFRLVVSEKILNELERVLGYRRIARKQPEARKHFGEFVDALRDAGFVAGDLYEVSVVKDDPSDDIFLAIAYEVKADYLVSEDPDLRNIKYFYGTQIVGLEQFEKEIGLK